MKLNKLLLSAVLALSMTACEDPISVDPTDPDVPQNEITKNYETPDSVSANYERQNPFILVDDITNTTTVRIYSYLDSQNDMKFVETIFYDTTLTTKTRILYAHNENLQTFKEILEYPDSLKFNVLRDWCDNCTTEHTLDYFSNMTSLENDFALEITFKDNFKLEDKGGFYTYRRDILEHNTILAISSGGELEFFITYLD